MKINISKAPKGVIGICGHIGVGHTHSHSGFVQDDGAGLAVAATILKGALPLDTTIIRAEADIVNSLITIETKDGGVGEAWVRRGITPWEGEMINKAEGMDTIYAQQIVLKTFGSIYGQGAMEVAVSLQAAVALALVDTFKQKYPGDITLVDEDLPSNIGKILGTVVDIDGIPVSMMLTINASRGGVGPVEDLEGNVILGQKGKLMEDLDLDKIPSIIIESKNYVPGVCDSLSVDTFLIRANRDADNTVVAKALMDSAAELGIRFNHNFDTLGRDTDDFIKASTALGERIVSYGEQFKKAETSQEKVRIISELASLVREDAGGVTFMSNSLQKSVGSAGMVKGTSAVLSLQVPTDYIEHYKIPFIVEADLDDYIEIIYNAIPKLHKELDAANQELTNRFEFDRVEYTDLLK